MQDQIFKSVYIGTGHSLPPFLARVSWEGKKQKAKPVFSLTEYKSHEALYGCAEGEACTRSGCAG